MSPTTTNPCEEVKSILWRWDPLFCSGNDEFDIDKEYSGYAPQIVNGVLIHGWSDVQLFFHMRWIQARHMGKRYTTGEQSLRDRHFAAAIIAVLRKKPIDLSRKKLAAWTENPYGPVIGAAVFVECDSSDLPGQEAVQKRF